MIRGEIPPDRWERRQRWRRGVHWFSFALMAAGGLVLVTEARWPTAVVVTGAATLVTGFVLERLTRGFSSSGPGADGAWTRAGPPDPEDIEGRWAFDVATISWGHDIEVIEPPGLMNDTQRKTLDRLLSATFPGVRELRATDRVAPSVARVSRLPDGAVRRAVQRDPCPGQT